MKFTVCIIASQYWPEWGGVATSAKRLVSYLIEEGFQVHIIVPTDMGDRVKRNVSQLQHISDIVERPTVGPYGELIFKASVQTQNRFMFNIMELLEVLDQKYKYDVFHGFWLPLAFPALPVAKKRDAPVIASIRGNDAFKSVATLNTSNAILTVLRRCDWITSVTNDLLTFLNAFEDISHKSTVVLNGVNTAGFPRWTLTDCVKGRIGTAGDLRFKKGIHTLAKVYCELADSQKSDLTLVGPYSDSTEKNKVHEIFKASKQIDQLRELGYMKRDQLWGEVVKFNVFVLPSVHDGLPNALLEALACGMPVVAFSVGGMADILTHEVDALLVEPGDYVGLKEAISRCLRDETLAKRLSENAVVLSRKRSLESEKASWLEVYNKVFPERLGELIKSA